MASSSQHKFRRVHLLSSAFASLTIAAPPAYAADDPVEAGGDIIGSVANSDTVSKIGLMYCQGQLR